MLRAGYSEQVARDVEQLLRQRSCSLARIEALRNSHTVMAVRPLVLRAARRPSGLTAWLRDRDTAAIAAQNAAASLFRLATAGQRQLIGRQLRARAYTDSSWWALSPRRLRNWRDAAEETLPLLGILAEHPNGRMREAAVHALLDEPARGDAAPLLCARLNDWVPEVRSLAGRGVVQLRACEVGPLVQQLDVLQQFERKHCRDPRVRVHLHSLLSSPAGHAALRVAWRHPYVPMRRLAFETALRDAQMSVVEVVEAALCDRDCGVQLWALRQAARVPELGLRLLRHAQTSRHAAVRARASAPAQRRARQERRGCASRGAS